MEVKDIKRELKYINDFLEEYRIKTDCKGVVLGLSGGKDSTVVAMLAKKQWGDDVFAIIMPNGRQSDIDDAIQIAETLNIEYKVVNIETIFNNLVLNIESKIEEGDWVENCCKISDKAITNIAPRIRMTILYAVAQTLGYRVIGTGNASERYIGWFTKYGDGGVDICPISHLTCSEVIQLGKKLCKDFNLPESFITKQPADGLTGISDEDNFGFSYYVLDNYIRNTLNESEKIKYENEIKLIEKLHKISEHKRKLPLEMYT